MPTKYLDNVENAVNPELILQGIMEEIERTNTFESQPTKISGVPTTREGPPIVDDGAFDEGAIWVDTNRARWKCIVAGTPGEWRIESPAPGEYALPADEIDWFKAGCHTITLSADTVLTFANDMDGMTIEVWVSNPSGYTLTWPLVLWAGGVAPTASSAVDLYILRRVGGVVYGQAVQNFA